MILIWHCFLKERVPNKIEEAKCLADRYLDARMFSKTNLKTQTGGNFVSQYAERPRSNVSGSRLENNADFDVKLNSKMDNNVQSVHQQNTYSKVDKRCFICNRSGHLARNCRTKVNEVTSREFANCFVEESFQCSVTNNLPIVKGTVFGIPVDVLRDTGCTTILVKRKYVPNCALTRKKKKLVLLDGTVHTVPTAKVLLESMFFSEEVDVLVVVWRILFSPRKFTSK